MTSSPSLPRAPKNILAKNGSVSASTKRAKDKENDADAANKQGRKASEAIANNLKRTMRRHVQRKSRVKPLTKSSASGRGNALTRRRKESRD